MKQFAFGTKEQFQDIWDRLTIGPRRITKFNVVIKPDTQGVLIFTTDENRRVVVRMETEGIAFDRYTGGSTFVKSLFEGSNEVVDSFDDFMHSFTGIRGDYDSDNETATAQTAASSRTQCRVNREQSENKPRIKINSAEGLASMLKEKIIGQDVVIDRIAVCVFNHLRKKHPKKPLTIMLPGPTGVGKTATAKVLAEILQAAYGEDVMPLITINCNEYREEHRISQLIGSPAGYVGYGEACVMEPLKHTDSAVIVMDEFEKAHAGIHLAVMNWIDSGKIHFSRNKQNDEDDEQSQQEFDCARSIIIMTSNISTNSDSSMSMRFGITQCEQAPESAVMSNDRCRDAMVAHGFKPEIAGRISYFFEYNALSADDVKKVLLLGFKNKATEYGVKIVEISDGLKDDIYNLYGSSAFGVRPLEYALDEVLGSQVPMIEVDEKEYKVSGTLEHLIFEEV